MLSDKELKAAKAFILKNRKILPQLKNVQLHANMSIHFQKGQDEIYTATLISPYQSDNLQIHSFTLTETELKNMAQNQAERKKGPIPRKSNPFLMLHRAHQKTHGPQNLTLGQCQKNITLLITGNFQGPFKTLVADLLPHRDHPIVFSR